jgi:hypothetical protein
MTSNEKSNSTDGCYVGETIGMTRVGTRDGVAILECDHCGNTYPKVWGKAKAHSCGVGEDVDKAGCCGRANLVDHWVVLDSGEGFIEKERKKKCENCGEIHPLGVMDRV